MKPIKIAVKELAAVTFVCAGLVALWIGGVVYETQQGTSAADVVDSVGATVSEWYEKKW